MKFFYIVLFSLLTLSAFAGEVSEKACSQSSNVCVSYLSEVEFTTKQEGRFQLALEATDQTEVTLKKVDLWMQMGSHGHGSSPLKVTQVAPGQYDITKAHFVMKGAWQIRVTYLQGEKQETLIIPVLVKE